MKISLIAPTFLPARQANTIQVMKMAQALIQCGHTVEVLVPDPYRSDQPEAFTQSRSQAKLAVQYGLKTPVTVRWLRVLPDLRSYDYGWKAVREAKRSHAQCIYTRLPQAATISSLLGIQTILEMHDHPTSWSGKTLFNLFLRGKGAQRLVLITQALAGDLSTTFKRSLSAPFAIVAPDGVDLDRYASLPSPQAARQVLRNRQPALFNNLPERFTVGYSGHLYPGRGVELILELAQRLPDLNFILVGGEPDDIARVQQATRKKQLANLVLTGFISNLELPEYQAACEVLIMPYQSQVSASSGGDIGRYLSPMKLFEYLACGRLILASNLPVLQEVLNPSNAILLPPTDVNAWVAAIQNGLQYPERTGALAWQAQQDAQQYTWTERVRKIFGECATAPDLKQQKLP